MENTQKQLLRDSTITPTYDVIAEGLGNVYPVYETFISELKSHEITLMEWRFYNDGKAWLSKGEYNWVTARGTKKVKPLFWLSIWEGFFKVSFFFSVSFIDELLKLNISENAIKAIKDANPMGKTMRFIPIILDIKEVGQLSDIYLLSQFRREKV